jgi:hypothetical protein
MPSCCSRPIWSTRSQSSMIRPSVVRAKIIPWTLIGRLVGGLPRNGPWWVPRIVQCAADLWPSLISSSTVQCRSGKAVRNMIINCLSPRRPVGRPQGSEWVTQFTATSSSTMARLPWLKAWSKIRLIREWLCTDDVGNLLVKTRDKGLFLLTLPL